MSPIALHCNYRNKKTGEVYYAFGFAINQTNAQVDQGMVIYKNPKDDPPRLYAREAGEFLDKFERLVEPRS